MPEPDEPVAELAVKASGPTISPASVPISNPPVRNSKSGSTNSLVIDFNGGNVQGTAWSGEPGGGWDCKPFDSDGDETTFSDTEQAKIIQLWEFCAEDFYGFDVNVTTIEPGVWDRYTGHAMVTPPTDDNGVDLPHKGYGGIAYLGVFGNADYSYDYAGSCRSPAWVMETSGSYSAEVATHEWGHNLALLHDGSAADGEYYRGHDMSSSSTRLWNAIMGGGVTPDISQWSKGEYYTATNTEDDLAIIEAKFALSGTGYRADDYGDDRATASAATTSGTSISDTGIIESTDDPDVFSFTTGAGAITLAVATYKYPTGDWGTNLDVLLELRDGSDTLVASNDPDDDTDAAISTTVTAGTYYVWVKPTSVGDPDNATTQTGYTSYGCEGQYTLTGKIIPTSISLSIDDDTVDEGDAGTVNATFDVTLQNATSFPVTVDYATADNTASAGTDYTAKTGTLTFNANETQQVTVVVNGDTADEGSSESFYVNLSNASGASIADSQWEGTITDDDAPFLFYYRCDSHRRGYGYDYCSVLSAFVTGINRQDSDG